MGVFRRVLLEEAERRREEARIASLSVPPARLAGRRGLFDLELLVAAAAAADALVEVVGGWSWQGEVAVIGPSGPGRVEERAPDVTCRVGLKRGANEAACHRRAFLVVVLVSLSPLRLLHRRGARRHRLVALGGVRREAAGQEAHPSGHVDEAKWSAPLKWIASEASRSSPSASNAPPTAAGGIDQGCCERRRRRGSPKLRALPPSGGADLRTWCSEVEGGVRDPGSQLASKEGGRGCGA